MSINACLLKQNEEIKLIILGGYLLILNSPGLASKMLVEPRGFPRDLKCVLEEDAGKLDIKRCEPGIVFINYPIG